MPITTTRNVWNGLRIPFQGSRPAGRERHVDDDQQAEDDAGHRLRVSGATRDDPEEEQAEHATAENAGQLPPGIQRAAHVHHRQGRQRSHQPDPEGSDLQDPQAFPFAGGGPNITLIAIAQDERGGAVDGAGERGLGGGENGGQHQPRQSDRQLADDEMREHRVRFSRRPHRLGEQLRTGGVECEQGGADEEENGRDGHVKQGATPDAVRGVTIGPGGLVALHVTLVDSEVLQVHEDTVDEDDPNGGLGPESGIGQVEAEAAEAELPMLGGDLEDLAGAGGHAQEEDDDAGERAADEDEALDDIGPDHGFHTAHEGIGDDEDAGDEDEGYHAPADEWRKGEGEQVHDGSHPGHLRQHITQGRIAPRPRPKTMLEMGIGRYFATAPIKRDKPTHRDPGGQWQRQAEHERVPVRPISLPRQRQETDAADIGAKDG